MNSTTSLVDIPCNSCSKPIRREVAVINPKLFAHPELAGTTSAFWCPHCDTMQGVRYRFRTTKYGISVSYYPLSIEEINPPKTTSTGLTIRVPKKRKIK